MKYFVQIMSWGDHVDEVIKEIDCGDSYSKAEKTEGGVNINLNHEQYYTRIFVKDAA